MKTVALISGGKDSCYNMMQCVAAGHEIVALANLQPQFKDELDSYMYQTVGHQGIDLYAEAMGLPLFRESITGVAVDLERNYKPTENDEVEDLYRLLRRVKDELEIEAVAVGAILSDYQRIRVENVCQRLNLVALAYLWRRNQKDLFKEMIASRVEAIIIKVAALGLDPRIHLGMSLRDIQPHLLVMQEKYGLNVCGEGGEYETFTLDCPLFRKRLVIDDTELVLHSSDPVAPVGYLNLRLHLEAKPGGPAPLPPAVRGCDHFVSDVGCVFSDLSDAELSESEVDTMDKIQREERPARDPPPGEPGPEEAFEEAWDEAGEGADWSPEEHGSICSNEHGWHFVGGVVGTGAGTKEAARDALAKLQGLLATRGLTARAVRSVSLFVRRMADYAELNAPYAALFAGASPPGRLCVGVPLAGAAWLVLEAVAYAGAAPAEATHVQGVSHWAPANIGPYSQAWRVGECVGLSGQLGLVPGSMALLAGASRQSALALRHLSRVVRAAHRKAHFRCVLQAACFLAAHGGGCPAEARRQLERRTAGALAQFVRVRELPRGAAVEWHADAHSDNCRFHYEETGCNVGDYKVAITRRWNYEDTVAAFVCCVATGPTQARFPTREARLQHRARARAASLEQLAQVLAYALRKLRGEGGEGGGGAVALRVFAVARCCPPAAVLLRAARLACERCGVRAALTLVPVLALHDAVTFLSVSGRRLDE